MPEPLNILVVDDEEPIREVIAALLDTEGHTTHQCDSAEEALKRLEVGGIDLIFTDVSMPKMSGIELIDLVLARNILPKDRIVAVTGLTFECPDVRWLTARKILVLFKPFDRRALRGSLETLFAQV